MPSTSLATEFAFEYSDRGGLLELTGFQADALRIQNVLIGAPCAGDFNYGVNIASYIMEIANPDSLSQLREIISNAIKTYCPDVVTKAIMVDIADKNIDPTVAGRNTLIIAFTLGDIEKAMIAVS